MICYKYYTEDGRRIAAFGREKEEKLELFLLYCSKKDMFSKKKAKIMYEWWVGGVRLETIDFMHPTIMLIPIEKSIKNTFFKFLKKTFLKKVEYVMRVPLGLKVESVNIDNHKLTRYITIKGILNDNRSDKNSTFY